MFLFHVRQGSAFLDVRTGGNMKVLSFVAKVLLSTDVTRSQWEIFGGIYFPMQPPLCIFFYIYYRNLTFYSLKYMELIIGS